MSITVRVSFPNLIHTPGRLAGQTWEGSNMTLPQAVRATTHHFPEAIVLRAGDLIGLAPGGMNTI